MSGNTQNSTVVIVGGSTGGASAAAQLRRMDESIHIIVIERTQYISTAYCGLAYAAGGIISSRDDLVPITPKSFSKRFNLEVRLNCSAVDIDTENRKVVVQDEKSGTTDSVPYTSLLLAPGAKSSLPDIKGVDLPGVFTLRNISQLDKILSWTETKEIRSVLVVGAGFIGLELAESFSAKGCEIHLVEAGEHVMAKMDTELMQPVHAHLLEYGVNLYFNTKVQRIDYHEGRHHVRFNDDRQLIVDMVLLVTGIQPENSLARNAKLALGPDGGILVDASMRSSNPHIYAIGDAVQIPSRVTGKPVIVPLAGPVNQQARVAAANITGNALTYPGPIGSFVCKVFDLTVASTGVNETHLQRFSLPYRKVIVPTTNHVFFYPGVRQILLKVLFDPDSGRLLGGQAVGGEGTEKRMDVLATAIAAGLTVSDLSHLELCYAPPYGAPRDPVNLAGSIGTALINNEIRGVYPDELHQLEDPVILDVRTKEEYNVSTIPGAIHIPTNDLRSRANEIPKNTPVVVVCAIGSKANTSQRMLSQLGFDCYNLLGGFTLWQLYQPPAPTTTSKCRWTKRTSDNTLDSNNTLEMLDVRGLVCPGPIIALTKRMKTLSSGDQLNVLSSDPGFENDIHAWANRSNFTVIKSTRTGSGYSLTLSKN